MFQLFQKDRRKRIIRITHSYIYILCLTTAFFFAGCAKQPQNTQVASFDHTKPVKLAYFGDITEAPLFAALKNGLFQEEGIGVELVPLKYEQLEKSIADGSIDGVTCDYRIFKSLESGTALKLVAGLHSGCIQIVVKSDSKMKSMKDLKGRTIGIETLGDGPMAAASVLLRAMGIDPGKNVKWKVLEEKQLEQAVRSGEVDALVRWEDTVMAGAEDHPQTDLKVLYSNSGGKPSGNQHAHQHQSFEHFYEGFVGLRSELVKKEPQKAAAITRAWIKGANWVSENPEAAVKIAMENRYVGGPDEANNKLVQRYMWMPGVRYAKDQIKVYIKEQKAQQILSASMNEKTFFNQIFAQIIPDWG